MVFYPRRYDAAPYSVVSALARRRVVYLSPFAATMLLTAAIFLLPATGDHHSAQASIDMISVSMPSLYLDDAAGLGRSWP